MNKKIITIVVVVIVLGGVAWWALNYLSQRVATINLTDKNTSVDLIKNAGTKNSQTVANFSNTSKFRLNPGHYCLYSADSHNYDSSDAVCFDIANKDISVTFTPNYSINKLSSLLVHEKSTIQAVINAKYAPIINNYRVATGALYIRGQWYGTTLTEITPPNERGDVYRVILQNINNQWVIAARPALALNKYDYPQIPHSVLDAVNKMDGTY